MAIDIALHPLGRPVAGNLPLAPGLPALQSQTVLADATDSDPIEVPDMGAYLVVVATAKSRLDVRLTADAANLDPATSGIVLAQDERAIFALPSGSYTLQAAAYA